MNANCDFLPRWMKFTALFVNIMYWILALFGITVGYYMHVYQISPVKELIFVEFSPAFMLVLMEIFLFSIATVGFVGTLRENICYLRWYVIALLMLLLAHVAMGVVAFFLILSPPTVNSHAEQVLHNSLMRYKDNHQAAAYIDRIQATIQCCGVGEEGYKEWEANPYFECNLDNYNAERCGVPATCCRFDSLEQIDTSCGYGVTQKLITKFEASNLVHTQGCAVKAEELIQNAAALLCFTAMGISTSMICGIVLFSFVVYTLRQKIDEYWKEHKSSKNVLHYNSNSGVFTISQPEMVNHSSKRTSVIDRYLPPPTSHFIL